MRLASLRQHLVYVKRQKPTVIVVDIGTNDLASPMCCPLHLANEVVSVARQFAASKYTHTDTRAFTARTLTHTSSQFLQRNRL